MNCRSSTRSAVPLVISSTVEIEARLDLLRKGPIGIRYASGFVNKWVATGGVSMRIVRNLGILKIILSIPTLSDQYKTGPLEVSLTINAIIRIGTLKKHNKKRAMIKSKTRFTMIYTLCQFFLSVLQ